MLNIFGLFGAKELGHYADIEIPGLNTEYVVRRRNSQESEDINVRILLANDDAVFTVYGVNHTPYVSAVSIDDVNHPGERIPAILISNAGRKKLKLNELQILIDYEMMRWTDSNLKAKTNAQPSYAKEYNPAYPNFYSVYEATTKTRKLQLVAENGKVAKRAFMKNEKSLLNLPREAYKQAAICKKIQEGIDAVSGGISDLAEDVVDLAGACS